MDAIADDELIDAVLEELAVWSASRAGIAWPLGLKTLVGLNLGRRGAVRIRRCRRLVRGSIAAKRAGRWRNPADTLRAAST